MGCGKISELRNFIAKRYPQIYSQIVYDDKYREVAFKDTISDQNDRGISLVDNIIRVMLKDGSHKIKALVTFNSKDFEDICYEEGIELINESFSFDTSL